MTPQGTVALSGFSSSTNSQIRRTAMRDLLGMNRDITFVRAAGDTVDKALDTDALVTQALNAAPPLQTVFPAGSLADQLKMVARLISARDLLGMRRQIFFVSLGGFDTHSGQVTVQEGLLTQLSQALSAFYAATAEMNVPERRDRPSPPPTSGAPTARTAPAPTTAGEAASSSSAARCAAATSSATGPRSPWAVPTTRAPSGASSRRCRWTSTRRRSPPGTGCRPADLSAVFPNIVALRQPPTSGSSSERARTKRRRSLTSRPRAADDFPVRSPPPHRLPVLGRRELR